jgi:cell division protein FtsB|tara:strand:- start:34 stop:237 length:204 start_codon:yes stop_codon:yes gene_type:complete
MNAQIVISTLQKKVSELTLINVMLEAQIQDLRSQLNSINEQTSDAQVDGNENQTQEIDDSSSGPDDF